MSLLLAELNKLARRAFQQVLWAGFALAVFNAGVGGTVILERNPQLQPAITYSATSTGTDLLHLQLFGLLHIHESGNLLHTDLNQKLLPVGVTQNEELLPDYWTTSSSPSQAPSSTFLPGMSAHRPDASWQSGTSYGGHHQKIVSDYNLQAVSSQAPPTLASWSSLEASHLSQPFQAVPLRPPVSSSL